MKMGNKMKKCGIAVFALLLFCAVRAQGQEVLDGIVAIVGNEIILSTELVQATQQTAAQLGIPVTQTEQIQKLKKSVLQELINEKVLLAKAKEDTIEVEDERVDNELESRIVQLSQQLGSRERVEETFGAPISKIKRDYREEVRKRLIVQAVQSEKLRGIQISRREVERYFDTVKDSLPEMPTMVKLRHIMVEIKAGGEARQNALDRMKDIQERLKGGENFEELARQYSEDQGTSGQGGMLGFVERGTLFPAFEAAAFQLSEGAVSEIVETPIGYHLIQMVEKRGDKVQLRHILIRVGATSNDDTKALNEIQSIRTRIMNGEAFADMAKQYSSDESTREQGGDLGDWLPVEQLVIPEFKTAVDTLTVGEISQPFMTNFGYHIVLLEAKDEARNYNLEKDWEIIRYRALTEKQQKALQEWVEELKKNIYVEIKEDLI